MPRSARLGQCHVPLSELLHSCPHALSDMRIQRQQCDAECIQYDRCFSMGWKTSWYVFSFFSLCLMFLKDFSMKFPIVWLKKPQNKLGILTTPCTIRAGYRVSCSVMEQRGPCHTWKNSGKPAWRMAIFGCSYSGYFERFRWKVQDIGQWDFQGPARMGPLTHTLPIPLP